MKKRIISLLLAVSMVITMIPNMAFAEENAEPVNETILKTDDELWSYEEYKDGVVLTEYYGTATDVYVPSTVTVSETECDVIKLGDGIFEDNDTLNSATLGAGIKEIGARAFYDADNMVCILTSEELVTIGDEAFYSCDSFNSIILYDAIESIGTDAFTECPKLAVWCNEGTVGYAYVTENGIPHEFLNSESLPQTVIQDGITYYISNGTAMVMSVGSTARIVIPASVNGYQVTALNSNALTSAEIFIPDSIVSIPNDLTVSGTTIIHCSEKSIFYNYAKANDISVIATKNAISIPTEVTDGDFVFNVYENRLAVLKSYIGTETGILNIPSHVQGVDVTKILPKAFNEKSFTEIVLPETIEYIYSMAFYKCSSLTTINIPEKVTTIVSGTFTYCSALKTVQLFDGIKIIESNAFASTAIESISFPDSLEYIGKSAFARTNLTEITYPLNAVVEDQAFAQCNLTKVVIPQEVTEFNYNAFIEANYFLNGPNEMQYIVFHVYPESPGYKFCKENGIIYNVIDNSGFEPYEEYVWDEDNGIDQKFLILSDRVILLHVNDYSYYGDAENVIYTVPEKHNGLPVTALYDGAFAEDLYITEIVIPNTIESIGVGAFYNLQTLTKVNIPEGIKTIGDMTFKYCTSLSVVELPDSLIEIGKNAFEYCSIKEIVFPQSLNTIEERAFANSALESLEYPNIDMGEQVFWYCDTLKSVTIEDGVNSLPNQTFYCCPNLTYILFSDLNIEFGENVFTGCSRAIFLVDDVVPTSSVYKYAHEKDFFIQLNSYRDRISSVDYTVDGITYNLTYIPLTFNAYKATVVSCDSNISGKLFLPEKIIYEGDSYNVCRIGYRAFADSKITTIEIPNNITSIGDFAFQGSSLTSIVLPEKLDYVGVGILNASKVKEFTFPTTYDLNYGLFMSTVSLEKVTIPEGVKIIPEYAFWSCYNVTELVLPDSLELIKFCAIREMSSLKSLIIPPNVQMEEDSIDGLPSLEKLVISEGVTTIPNTFGSCKNLALVYLPKSVTSIDYEAFTNCPKAIFCVYENSYAQEYCEKRCLPYYVLRENGNPEILYGTSISGTVSYSDGTTATNATVEILYDDGTVKESVTTDLSGVYEFTYAEVGQYTIRVTDVAGYTASQTFSVKRMNVFNVFLAGDTSLTLKQGWSINGTANENNATITLTDEEGNVIQSIVTENGTFEIHNVPNGTYILKAEADSGFTTKEITVFNGDISDLTLIIETETSTIWGYVEVEDRGKKHHRRNWVQVTIYNEDGNAVSQIKSDKDGKYEVTNLPLGEYTIVAETAEMRPDKKHGYDRSHILTGYAYVNAEEETTYQAETIVLYEENDSITTISGKVTAKGESQSCEITLRNVFRYEVANQTTGKNGKYAFKNVKDGLYFITATTENDGMGFAVVVVRNGHVYGETDIKVLKSDKVKKFEEDFKNDVPECKSREDALKYRERIANEKRHYDGLSAKEKKQLSKDYVKRLNQYCEWLANCAYTTDEGVTVEQGGLVVSGNELENEDTITFNLNVEKKTKHELNGEGVKSNEDYIQHSMEDASKKQHDYGILEYYEISMTKKQGEKEQTITCVYKDTDATGKFRITIDIPEEYRGYKHYSFIHVHKGEVVTLVDLDDNPNTVTFEVDAFSTFALLATNEEQTGQFVVGDLDNDSDFTELDIAIMRTYLTKKVKSFDFATSDINEDNAVDIRDVIALKRGIVEGTLISGEEGSEGGDVEAPEEEW